MPFKVVQATPIVFLWNDSFQEKTLVAASASSNSVEVYYAVEKSCARQGGSCTVSSHAWYEQPRRYFVEQFESPDAA